MNRIKREIQNYRPKFNALVDITIGRLNDHHFQANVNSSVHKEEEPFCDWLILVMLVICTFLFCGSLH